MKNKILLTVCFIALLSISASAKIWRVNNNTAINADYSDLQLALTNTPAGDTLYVEGSQKPYKPADSNLIFCIYKKLTIVGPGNNLVGIEGSTYDKFCAELDYLCIAEGADGTKIEGMKINQLLYIGANNITISRNYINGIQCCTKKYDSGNGPIFIVSVSDIKICKNLISYLIISNKAYQVNYDQGSVASKCIISNNIVRDYITGYGHGTIITNNTVLSTARWIWEWGWSDTNDAICVTNSIVQNNIIVSSVFIGSTTYATNTSPNVFHSANNTISNNVVINNTTFTGTGSFDAQYLLSPHGSNASKAGVNGVDCGAFGGSDPYVLGGMPAIPHVYSISAPASGTATSGIAVTIKVKSQK